jgi:hypothetical protein
MTENKIFRKKLSLSSTVIIILLGILLVILGVDYYRENTKIIPKELLSKSINNTLSAKSYRFKTKSTINLDGEGKVFSNLTGEKSGENCFHVTGSMLGTEVNVYQINNTTYRMDPLTQRWIITDNNSLIKESLLMAELNPLSNFYFKELVSASYLGKEKISNKKLYKLECIPKVQNKWLDNYFKDLKYLVWVDKKHQLINKAIVTATSKENESGRLTVEVELYNHNEKITIEAPVLK